MNKYCYATYEFEAQVTARMEKIAKYQRVVNETTAELKKLKLELKTMGVKGNCDQCEHRLECITNNKEGINVKVKDGW
jgi:hypothetical protein